MIKNNLKKGISLIVLVITIIVLAILATTVIINISNSSVMTEARIATFKSDMQNFKSAYSLWLAGYISESGTYDITTINYPAGDQYLLGTVLGGNVPDKYKAGLKVVEGRLVYETDDEEQKEIVNGLDMGTSDSTSKANYAWVHCSKLNDFEFELDEEDGIILICPDIEWVEDLETMYEKMEMEMESYMSQMVYNIPDIETAEQAEECIATLNGYSTFDELLQEEGITREDLKEDMGVDSDEAYEEYVIIMAKDMASKSAEPKSATEIESYITYVYGYDTFEEYLQAFGISQDDLPEDEEEYLEGLMERAEECAMFDYYIYKFIGPNATLSDIENLAVYLYGKGSYENMFPLNYMGEYTWNSLNDIKLLIGEENVSDRVALEDLIYHYFEVGFPSDVTYVVTNGVDTSTSCVPCGEFGFFIVQAFPGLNTITLTAPDGTSITKQVSRYSVEYNLSNCTSSNTATSINYGDSYSTTLTADFGYNLSTVTVTVGGSEVSGAYSNGTISLTNVTGDVVITATATTTYTVPISANGSWNSSKGVNNPKLYSGMIAVAWDSSGNEILITDSNYNDWFDYSSQKWANARTADGSYWVWIPRYAYKIDSGRYTDTAGAISVEFLQGTTDKDSSGTTISKTYPSWSGESMSSYVVHPAFINDSSSNYMHGGWDAELPGIWVAKYKMSNDGKNNMVSKPGVQSWRDMKIGDIYTKCINYNTTLQSHMIKNSEWGAVAYLAHSSFGRNGVEVTKNSENHYTGGSENATATTNPLQSTTGNATGIFDMIGYSCEYVAGYISNGNSCISTNGSSFASTTAAATGYQTLSTKYVTVYPYSSSSDSNTNSYTAYKDAGYGYGDAILETSATNDPKFWFSIYYAVLSNDSFFERGDMNMGLFSFYYYSGTQRSFVPCCASWSLNLNMVCKSNFIFRIYGSLS